MTMPLGKVLKKDTKFVCAKECQRAFDELKEKLETMTILVLPDWTKECHVHGDAFSIVLGAILAQPGDRKLIILFIILLESLA